MRAPRGASPDGADTPAPRPPEATGPTGASRRAVALLLGTALVVWVVDQATKIIAMRELAGGDRVTVVDGVLWLRLVRNPGAAFGLAGELTAVFTVVAVVVAVLVLRAARRLGSRRWGLALGLLLGGAVGNLTDRLVRDPAPLRGHVVDFLELPNWPVFNVADMAIMTAAGLLLLLTMRAVPMEAQQPAPAADPGAAEPSGG